MRKIVKPIVRRSCPAVTVAGVTVTSGLPTMVVTLDLTEPDAHRKFRKFCHRKDVNVGWELLDTGVYLCAGGFDNLLALTDRWWVKDWWWDHDTRVVGGSGRGEKPKRAKAPRFVPTSREGAKVVAAMARDDARHT